MNAFLVQNIQSQIELEEIADVKRQLIIPKDSKTIIGISQDGLIGGYMLTQPTTRIDWKSAMNIISYTNIDDFNLIKKKKELTGHELYSLIVPPKINLTKGSLVIKNGKLESGLLSKGSLGAKQENNLTQLIWDEYGIDSAKDFLDNTQRLINNFNLLNGASIGIGDIVIPKNTEEEIEKIVKTKELKIKHQITEAENNPELMDKGLFEKFIERELNTIREDSGKLVQNNFKSDNNLGILVSSGSKGDPTNIGKMCGCVGLVIFEGGLVQKKVNGRTLPYFHKDNDYGKARGFIKNSYLVGEDYEEYFFDNLGSREGMITQAVNTADTGYVQRKLIKTMEDAMVAYDGTVRLANRAIVQYVYGDSGTDTTKQYNYNFKILEMGDGEIASKYTFTKEELKNVDISEKENNELLKELLEMRDNLRLTQIKVLMEATTLKTTMMLPVNFKRIIDNSKDEETGSKTKLTAKYVIERLEEVLRSDITLLISMKNEDRKSSKSIKAYDDRMSKYAFRVALYESLNPKRCIIDYGFSKAQFDYVIEQVINSFNKNLVEAGEMVGIIAAQSMGEPSSQMSLNAFHKAGVGRIATITAGVPRIKEIMSLSKNMKTPTMYIYLMDEYMKNKEMAKKIGSHIKYTTLGHVRERINIYYDPLPMKEGGFMDTDNVHRVFYTHTQTKNSCQMDVNNLPWLMRVELSKEKMLEKEVTLLEIKSKFCNYWEKRFSDSHARVLSKEERAVFDRVTQIAVLSNTEFDEKPILHIRFDLSEFDVKIVNDFIDHIIDKFKLKGIKSINGLYGVDEQRVISFKGEDNTIEKMSEYVIFTDGVNLVDTRYIIGIDNYRTITNDINQIYEHFGIEAARAAILREIYTAFDQGASVQVNYQHIQMLADVMCRNGHMMSVDRHGMNKSDNEPLGRASFEKSVDQLIQAAVFSEVDNMKGISARLMGGLVMKGGTGLCDLILNTDMIMKSEQADMAPSKYDKSYVSINKNTIIQDVIDKENENIFMPE